MRARVVEKIDTIPCMVLNGVYVCFVACLAFGRWLKTNLIGRTNRKLEV